MLGLAQLRFQLGLQLPAALLKLQQLLPGLLAAAGADEKALDSRWRQKEAGTPDFISFYLAGALTQILLNYLQHDIHSFHLCCAAEQNE